jgi:lysophospholipase L1-like esterase
VALGDSFTCGEGVGVRVPAGQTWTALLARSLGGTHTSYAAPGCRVRDVRRDQLPRVGDADVATVLIGLNDVVRGGFDPEGVRADLTALVDALRARVPVVLVCRLHDPTRMLWFPRSLRRIGLARLAVLQAAVDGLRGVEVLDLEDVAAWRHPGAWDVDRVHPSVAGHAALGRSAGLLLQSRGLAVQLPPAPVLPRGASVPGRAVWSARHGLPYVAGHVRELGAPVWQALSGASGERPAHRP